MKLNDLTGRRFGRLTVVYRDTSKASRPYWVCKCDCGNITSIKGCNLLNATTKSCGCLKYKTIHGDSIDGKRNRLNSIYHNMISRCYNANSISYSNYGGRGIAVCEEWLNDYLFFRNWALGSGYNDSLSLDRIDVNGNYEPTNCRWATVSEQCNNKRNNILVEYNGETLNAKQWSKKTGIKYSTIIARINRNLPPEDILRKEGD